MDISAIIVVIVMTALAFGAVVGLEIYSRGKEAPADEPAPVQKRNDGPRAVSEGNRIHDRKR